MALAKQLCEENSTRRSGELPNRVFRGSRQSFVSSAALSVCRALPESSFSVTVRSAATRHVARTSPLLIFVLATLLQRLSCKKLS